MAQPVSIRNDRDQSIDTVYTIDGDKKIKFAVGVKNVGLTDEAAWQAAASHTDDEDFDTGDGVSVVAGVISATGKVKRFLVDALGRAVVAIAPQQGNLTDRSGSITTGATQQQMMAANSSRKYLLIENVDTGEDLWINFTTAAVRDQPSIKILPGGSFVMEASFISTEVVSVIATTTGHEWTAKEA